jgi:hypothetical protein
LEGGVSRVQRRVNCTCPLCGKPFLAMASRARHGRGKHCSPECQYEARRRSPKKRVARTCVGCGVAFELEPAKLTARKGAGKYCTRACRDKHRVGELHPQFVGTRRYPGDYGKNWQAQKRRARRRDGCCQRCGKTGVTLDVHHKIPIRLWENKETANDLDNLVSLCKPCHRTTEAETTWVPLGGGVLGFATGGATHELAEERQMLVGHLRRQPHRSPEERALDLEIAIQDELINREMMKPAGERNWAPIFARLENRDPLPVPPDDPEPVVHRRTEPQSAQLELFK